MSKTGTPAAQKYTRFTKLPIDVVLPILQRAHEENPGASAKVKEDIAGKIVKVTGVRLNTFATKGCKCSACGFEAAYFAIETQTNAKAEAWHLNLWGVDEDGEEILFTHDHTLARSAGGADNLTNTTTMCSPCNFAKSLVEPRYTKKEK